MVILWIVNRLKDTFEATVHNNESITNIEKFTYLKTYLDKSALQAIEGFPLTNENYTEALNLLNGGYGNEKYVIPCHMKKLVKLEPVIHPGVKDWENYMTLLRVMSDH